jgi:hypothetical protein
MSGTLLKTLSVSKQEDGMQKAVWDRSGSPVSKGIYVCTISIENAGDVTKTSFKIPVLR